MAHRVLYQFPGGYRDLAGDIVAAAAAGQMVVWLSASGTASLYGSHDGCLIRVRRSITNPHPGDDFPLMVVNPFTATSCGAGDGAGFRSTPPVLVAVIDTPEDVESGNELGRKLRQQIDEDVWRTIPPDHPDHACTALYCRVRLAAEAGE